MEIVNIDKMQDEFDLNFKEKKRKDRDAENSRLRTNLSKSLRKLKGAISEVNEADKESRHLYDIDFEYPFSCGLEELDEKVSNWVDFSVTKLEESDDEKLERALNSIAEFRRNECGIESYKHGDDLSSVVLINTTTHDGKFDLRIEVDLIDFTMSKFLEDERFSFVEFECLDLLFYWVLFDLDFQELRSIYSEDWEGYDKAEAKILKKRKDKRQKRERAKAALIKKSREA